MTSTFFHGRGILPRWRNHVTCLRRSYHQSTSPAKASATTISDPSSQPPKKQADSYHPGVRKWQKCWEWPTYLNSTNRSALKNGSSSPTQPTRSSQMNSVQAAPYIRVNLWSSRSRKQILKKKKSESTMKYYVPGVISRGWVCAPQDLKDLPWSRTN